MASRLLLVGCGNIGSRHLQALARLPKDTEIIVVEPNSSAKQLAESRLDEVGFHQKEGKITWLNSISNLAYDFDLVIVATNSYRRLDVITKLLEMGNKRFLIEKMICQSKQEYETLLQNFEKHNSKGWVNTNRRYFPIYQQLKNKLGSLENIKISATAANRGLGSNAIHFIDLFLWFVNNDSISLNGDLLDDKLYSNKRGEQYVEFGGTISGTSNTSGLSITFLPVEKLPLTIEIINKNYHVIIDETNEKIFNIRNLDDLNTSFEYLHVSDLTYHIVLDILKNNNCLLPSVNQLYSAHCELFRIFNAHIKKLKNEEPTICPIT